MLRELFFRLLPWALLIFLGCVWGLTFSLARLSVDVGGKPLGMTFWQCLIGSILLLIFSLVRKRPPSFSVANIKVYITVALLGASIPTSILYFAAKHVQAGILSITVALIPMITYSFAAFLRTESFSATRIFGVLLGCVSVGLLVLPDSSLPEAKAAPWILLACLSAVCWAMENIYLSKFALTKMGPLRIAVGMNFFAAIITFPIAIYFDQMFFLSFPFGVLEWTILLLSIIGAVAYTLFIKVINLAGPVFASQTGYLVTIGGVIWGILLFNEVHSGWVWASFITILIALFFVSPQKDDKKNYEIGG